MRIKGVRVMSIAALFSVSGLSACGTESASDETIPPLLSTTTVLGPQPTEAPTAPPTSATATTVSSTSTIASTSTTVAATTTTSIPRSAALVVRPNGLGDALFGTDFDQTVAYMTANLGEATADSGWADPLSAFGVCPGTEVRGVTWGDLTLLFSDDSPYLSGRRHFFHYQFGPPFGSTARPAAMATAERIGIGSTVGELRYTYPDVVLYESDEFLGPSFVVPDGVAGTLSGLDDDDLVRSFDGGVACGE